MDMITTDMIKPDTEEMDVTTEATDAPRMPLVTSYD